MSGEVEQRRRKLEQMRAAGHDPFTRSARGAVSVAEALAALGTGADVFLGGRVTTVRGMGKASFLDVRDETGRIQVYIRQDKIGDAAYALFQLCDHGDFIAARGKVDKTRTGEPTLFAESFEVVAKALRPLPEKWHGLKDVETRYRQRYLDLAANPEVVAAFHERSRLLRDMRRFLDARGFLEVETPMMHAIPGGATARPFVTHHKTLDMDLYLRIAPELHLKRLLVGGFRKVYEINRCFRNEGISQRHNPEFTTLELYQAFADLSDVMDLTEELIFTLAGRESLTYGERTIPLKRPWARKRYGDLLREHAGIGLDDAEAATRLARERQIGIEGLTGRKIAAALFEKLVEPKLDGPVFVIDYPVEICPLTRRRTDDPTLAERFELFVAGMEVANAFSELNDPDDQRGRLMRQLAEREEGAVKLDEDFLTALEHGMPPAGGLGIGIDRLVMLLTGKSNIREVILFPLLRPE